MKTKTTFLNIIFFSKRCVYISMSDNKDNKNTSNPSIFSRMTSSIGNKTSSLASSMKDSMKEAVTLPPKLNEITVTNRLNLQNDQIETMKCKVYVSCDVGKIIRNKILEQLQASSNSFVDSLSGLERPSGKIDDIYGFSTKAKTKVDQVNKSYAAFEKSSNAVIKLEGLECKFIFSNAVDRDNKLVDKIDGKIVEINPKTKSLKVEGTGFKLDTTGKTGPKQVKISEIVSIASLCVGGASSDDQATNNCLNSVPQFESTMNTTNSTNYMNTESKKH